MTALQEHTLNAVPKQKERLLALDFDAQILWPKQSRQKTGLPKNI